MLFLLDWSLRCHCAQTISDFHIRFSVATAAFSEHAHTAYGSEYWSENPVAVSNIFKPESYSNRNRAPPAE